MASVIYNSFIDDVFKGNIDCDTDSFKAMAVTNSYTENVDTHVKRSDITSEVTGTGYTAGGVACTVSVTKDTANNRVDIGLGAVSWGPGATIASARKIIVYKSRGGASSADELVACIDNGSDVSVSNGTLSVTASTIRNQLP